MKQSLHILIIDDNFDDVELCQRELQKCETTDYSFTHVKTGEAGLEALNQKLPDCILLDYSLPKRNGLSILRQIHELYSHIPVIILTGQGNDTLAAQFIRAGAQDYIVKSSIDTTSLHTIILEALTQSQDRKRKIETCVMIVDDNPDDRERCVRALKRVTYPEYRCREIQGGAAMHQSLISDGPPDCILLDYSLPGKNGLDLLSELTAQYPFLPVIIMTGQGNERVAVQAIKDGAQNYIVKGDINQESLNKAITSAIKNSDMEKRLIEKENQLREANALKAAIMKSASHLIIATDTNGVVTSFNKAAEGALGYDSKEVIGQHTPALWHNADEVIERAKELSKELGREVLPGFEVFILKPQIDGAESREWTFHRKDKTFFPTNLTVTCVRDHCEKIVGYLGIIDDITEKKKQEREHFELRQALQLAVEGISKVDIKGCYTYANEAFAGKIGYSPDELIGKKWESTIVADELASMKDAHQKMMSEGKAVAETVGLCKDGSTIYKQITMVADCNEDGSFSGHFCFMQDISDRKKDEIALKNAKTFQDLILSNIPDYVFVIDEKFKIVEANPAFMSLYPQEKQNEIIGHIVIPKITHKKQRVDPGLFLLA